MLLQTGVLEAFARTHRNRFIVETSYPELFLHNPHVLRVWPADRRDRFVRILFDHPGIWQVGSSLNRMFERYIVKPVYPFPCRNRHLIDAMAESVSVRLLPEERRPFIYLTQDELQAQSWAKGWIAVQSSSTNYWTVNKHWVPGRMQEVVNMLSSEGLQIVHLGTSNDDPLTNVKDLRGKLTLRQSAAVLSNARLLIGLEGGLVHLARAVGTKAVVVYTGYTIPAETGYPQNQNIRAASAGDPCWRRDPCEHCSLAAALVTVEEVIEASVRLLRQHKAYDNVRA